MSLLKQSTDRDKMVFMTDSTDHVTGKTSLTLTITASKNGAAFASISPTVTERGNGWYALALTSSHTDTLGDIALHVTATGADPTDVVWQVIAGLPGESVTIQTGTGTGQLNISSGVVESNLKQIDGLATNGNNATLKLKQLSVINSEGSAIVATANGGNGNGILSVGDGTGHGIYAKGADAGSGDGINARGGASGGSNTNGIYGQANGTGSGIVGVGASTGGAGILANGGSGANGMQILGGTLTGDALVVTGRGSLGASKGAVFTGSGGAAEIDADITGNIIGDVTGSVAEATMIGAGGIDAGVLTVGALNEIRNKFLLEQISLNSPTVTSNTVTIGGTNAANDDAYIGATLLHFNASNEFIQMREITDFDLATFTVTVGQAWTVNPVDTDIIHVYANAGIASRSGRINIKKNVAFPGFSFTMYDSTTHLPLTGLTVTAERSIDGGAFAACSNAVSEVSSGGYKLNLSTADLNGDIIKLKFTAPGADQQDITIVTQE
jgi:hypothetical protein